MSLIFDVCKYSANLKCSCDKNLILHLLQLYLHQSLAQEIRTTTHIMILVKQNVVLEFVKQTLNT